VNFLNENVVDIDLKSLQDFDTTMDEGGGKEMGEIKDGAFDSLQPTQRKRTMNYTSVEDACLVWAWGSVT
jgi:hypothetical protein